MTLRVLTDETERTIADQHFAGVSRWRLAKDYRVSRVTIDAALARCGIAMRTNLTDDQFALVLDSYTSGMGVRRIASSLGLRELIVANAIRCRGIVARRTGCPRTYPLDERAFVGAENNPDAAYFIGLIAADGCIMYRKSGWRLSLGVTESDRSILESALTFMGSGAVIRTRTNAGGFSNGNAFCSFTIDSTPLVESLMTYGIAPRKSLTGHIVGLEFNPHFWRGCIDGDGFLMIPRGKYLPQPVVGLVGAKPIIDQFATFVRSVTECRANVRPLANIWRFEMKGRYAIQLAKILYGEGRVSIARKQAIANDIVTRFDPQNGRPFDAPVKKSFVHLTVAQLESLYLEYGTWTKAAASLGTNQSTISVIRKRLGMR